jgi:LPXTG-site transpeptidase (sortase) family protein
MNTSEGHAMILKPKPIRKWLGIILLFAILAAWLILGSPSASQAAPSRAFFQHDETTPTPLAYFPIVFKEYPPFTPTPSATTVTAAPTATATSTSTNTPTATSTATGTLLTPNIAITAEATPSEVKISQIITFKFTIINSGSAPATNVAFLDSLPSSLDITSVTTTKGSKVNDAHSVTITIGTLNPDETVTITINAKVNTGAITQALTNTGVVTYDVNKSLSKSVNYKVVGSALPGTGEIPIEPQERAGPDPSLIFLSLSFGLGAVFAIWYGFWARANKLAGVKWYFGVGILLIAAALVTGLAGGGVLQPGKKSQPAPIVRAETPVFLDYPTPEMLAGFEIAPAFEATAQPGKLPVYRYTTAEPLATLPSYPIPTPIIGATPENITETLDTSPIVRLVIPTLEVDAEVKYVPWDTTLETWLITGLRQEIAWLGGSSWPGLGSNTVLAGHVTIRDYGNGPFRFLDELKAGDEITVYTYARAYTYRVREATIVAESDLWVTEPTENPQLTLITCTDWNRDFQLYLKRLIIFADLVRSDPISASAGN